LLRDGISVALADQTDIRLVAEAADGREGVEQYCRHRPDVTLMDLQMPGMGGLEALGLILRENPEARVIVLTTYGGDVLVTTAIRSGARGFLLKGMLRKDLRDTIRAVHAGKRVLPPELAMELAEHAGQNSLTAREVAVLKAAARGNSNREIAVQLHVSEDTVKAHMKSIFTKLDARDRTHAVMVALKRGILEV
jgi:two-component system NarL family response regulator